MTKPKYLAHCGKPANAYTDALKAQKPVFMLTLGLSALVNLLMLTGSVYMLQVYDRVLSSGSVPTLVGLFSIVVILYGFLGFFDFLRIRLLSRIATRLDLAVGKSAFGSWVQSGAQGYRDSVSDLQTVQPLRDLSSVRQFLSSTVAITLFDLPFAPIFLVAMFLIHPLLGMMVIAGAVLAGLMALLGRIVTDRWQKEAMRQNSNSQEFSNESHHCAETIIAMGMQTNVERHWQKMHQLSMATQQKISNPSEILASCSKTLRLLLQSAILTVGAWLVLQSQMSAGMIIASSILSGRALAPVDQIIGQWRSIGRAAAAHRALHNFFGSPPQTQRFVDLPAPTGEITVSRLTKFSPKEENNNPNYLLSSVQFNLKPGDGLGVIGKSGSGKSTFVRLLVGALRPDKGEIRFDGATHAQWAPSTLGKSIGYLPQKVELLSGSISNNIARFDPKARSIDVIAAAKLVGIHEMILSLPDGYETQIGGQTGMSLSGGQLQRIGLARAVYGMPRIVVLDEPNSNLDAEGDEALAHAITSLRAAKSTVIVVAHRPSAISTMSKVMILHEGHMVRFGNKEDVLGPPKEVSPAATVTSLPTRQAHENVAINPREIQTAIPNTSASAKLAKILKAERTRAVNGESTMSETVETA